MEKDTRLIINTRIDTRQAAMDLKGLTAAVGKTFSAIGYMGSNMKIFSESRVVEQFKGISQVFGEKLTDLKILVGKAVIPIASMLTTIGNSLVDFFAAVSGAVGGLTEKLFGALGGSEASAKKAAKGQTVLAKATTAAGTAAKGALAAFDELNVLEKKGGGGGGSGGKPPKPDAPEVPEGGAVFTFLEQLLKALEPLTEELFAGLAWGYENVLKPLGEWAGNELLPSFLGMVSGAAGTLASVLDLLKPVGTWLWESFLQPMGEWSGEMVIIALNGVAGAFEALGLWIEDNKEKLASIWETVEPLFTLISDFILGIFEGIKEFFALWIEGFTEMLTGSLELWLGLITSDWQQAWRGIQTIFEAGKKLLLGGFEILWEAVKNGFGKCWEAVKLLWAPVNEWFMQNVMVPIDKSFGWLWSGVVTAASIAWKMVQGVWEPLSSWFMEKVAAPIASIAGKMWEDISSAFTVGLDFLRGMLADYVNLCLKMFEGGANVIIGVFNKIIDALNSISVDIPDWVPEYGGRSFGISIPSIPNVSIPKLATGAVIPPNAQFAAILGDQRSGRNLEAPEGLIREIVREESGAREVVVRFEGSMAQLARVLAPAIEQENARQGTRLIVGGT